MQIYVHIIDGAEAWTPVPCQKVSEDEYLILDNDVFDPKDTTCLMQFIPGDVVKIKEGIAIQLVSTSAPDRQYWKFLYVVVSGNKQEVDLPSDMNIIDRITAEIANGKHRHYPAVIEWIKNQSGM
jgi:hypothetical protein